MAFRAEGEQFSERSDAGSSIVQEVFGFVKKNYPERSGGRAPVAEKEVRGKGRQPLSPPQDSMAPASVSSTAADPVSCAWNRRACRCDGRCVVDQAVQDAVGGGGIADLFVPTRDRQLGSEHRRASLIAILADLPEVAALGFTQR